MADTFVLLHGLTGGPESFDALARELPAGARLVRPLLAGHGPCPTLPERWAGEVSRLVGLLEDEGVEGAHLVGYSMGGRLGWSLLDAAPARFSRATLIGAHPGLATRAEREARRAEDQRWIELLERDGLDAFLAAWEALPLWRSQASLPAELEREQRRVRRQHQPSALAAALRALGLAEMPPARPERIRVPVTLVVGALDQRHLALASELAPKLPRGRCRVVPDAGHNVLLERPQALARLLTEEMP